MADLTKLRKIYEELGNMLDGCDSKEDDNTGQFKDKDENDGGQESLANLNPEIKATGPEDKKKKMRLDTVASVISKKLSSKRY